MALNRLWIAVLSGAFLCSAGAQVAPPTTYELHIERQPLVRILNEFSRQTGLQIIGMLDTAANARHIEVGPLIGQYTVEEAMRVLLSNTGLAFGRVNATTIAVMPMPTAPETKTT
jgi:hypothetical protein